MGFLLDRLEKIKISAFDNERRLNQLTVENVFPNKIFCSKQPQKCNAITNLEITRLSNFGSVLRKNAKVWGETFLALQLLAVINLIKMSPTLS
tara:strand:+ start:466 stop:744 length:279 start_codon:yes stop_codon:yes gene_type:complete